jgi:response regulator of citrate/malate metabolism
VIRTLVIDDDYRVAGIHAASVDRVDGFHCVGQAHTAAEARDAITRLKPALLLLDVHLPDEDGLSLLRSLKAAGGAVPDCILITAARDLHAVREAIRLGAMYYLVKPFSFDKLRAQLDVYRTWREQVERADPLDLGDQAAVDELFQLRNTSAPTLASPNQLPPTMDKILHVVQNSATPASASDIAQTLGMSRPTAQRYLTELQRRGLLELDVSYGATGRPAHRYRPANRNDSPNPT